ncbi:hypothetical protein [uncultured Aquimarina sp.]|uniref:hypothetical protein n=1 Tax=uncultured Aquimarina sp. TaxID=575652 RepID=UPI0026295A04|nr:hypothetical protein [uncultured Aquimarina sp.]
MSKLILILIVTLVTFFYGQYTKESNLIKKENSTAQDSLTTILKNSNKEVELPVFSEAIIDQNYLLYSNGFGFASSKNKLN